MLKFSNNKVNLILMMYLLGKSKHFQMKSLNIYMQMRSLTKPKKKATWICLWQFLIICVCIRTTQKIFKMSEKVIILPIYNKHPNIQPKKMANTGKYFHAWKSALISCIIYSHKKARLIYHLPSHINIRMSRRKCLVKFQHDKN